jgi:hypothetical protein
MHTQTPSPTLFRNIANTWLFPLQNATSSTTSLLRQAYDQGIRKFVLTSSYLAMVGTGGSEEGNDEGSDAEEGEGESRGVWSVYVFSDRGVFFCIGSGCGAEHLAPLLSFPSSDLPLVITYSSQIGPTQRTTPCSTGQTMLDGHILLPRHSQRLPRGISQVRDQTLTFLQVIIAPSTLLYVPIKPLAPPSPSPPNAPSWTLRPRTRHPLLRRPQ